VGEGTGLGLAVVHGIVTSLGGAISVESEVDQGSRFTLHFPLSAEEAVPDEEALLPESGDEHVLFVDDEPTICRLVEKALRARGFTVVSRPTGNEALKVLLEDPQRVDVLVTDQAMPGLSGIELVREARALRPDLPILLITGFGSATDWSEAEILGVDRILMKPVDIPELTRAVREVLDGHTARPASDATPGSPA
jgi:CheY-like chemotaxis protein